MAKERRLGEREEMILHSMLSRDVFSTETSIKRLFSHGSACWGDVYDDLRLYRHGYHKDNIQ